MKVGDIVSKTVRWADGNGYTIIAPVVREGGKLVTGRGSHVTHYEGESDRPSKHIGGAEIDGSWTVLPQHNSSGSEVWVKAKMTA
jgi:hypothetical protein